MTVDGMAITPAFNFDIYVVPNTVVWSPSLPNSAWHNDDNWKTTDGKPAFIPLSETNVIIRKSSNAIPVLPISNTNLGEGANQILKYDLTPSNISTFSSCKNIYFESGAEIARQNKLKYQKAYVDMDFDKEGASNWEMLSMPLENVVRGDLYIPLNGDANFNFAEAALVDNRKANSFRLKAYASSFENIKIQNGNITSVKVTSSTWTEESNKFNLLLEKCRGYAVSRVCATNQNFVRLPKTETTYYMYSVSGTGVEKPIKTPWASYGGISRTNSHKLVYDSRFDSTMTLTFVNQSTLATSGAKYFLIGNPFMVNLDVARFFEVNSAAGLNSLFWYEYAGGAFTPVAPSNKVLRPMRAMFVQAKDTRKEITVKFTPSMMSFNEVFEVDVVPHRSRVQTANDAKKLTLTANVEGKIAHTFIEETNYSSKNYSDSEDAELFMLDAELTPIGLYSVADSFALLYNATPDVVNIPISVFLLDSTITAESFGLTFDGVDSFDETLYLYDNVYETMLPLIDGLTLELEMPKAGEIRYYVTRDNSGGTPTDDSYLSDAKLCVVTNDGLLSIYSNLNINDIEIYDIAGRLVHSSNLNSTIYEVELPTGVYMLQVVVGDTLKTQKVIVK